MIETDVIIVGGGPAGSACARRLRENNIDCMILDKQRFPRYKPCAGWITPEVFPALELDAADYPYGVTEFTSFKISIRRVKFTLPTRQFAIRRYEFDVWLLNLSKAPVKIQTVKTIEQTENRYVIDNQYACKYLIGAGGTFCPVKRSLFSGKRHHEPDELIVAMEEEFLYNYTDNNCRLWFMEDKLPGYAWYVPKIDGYVNVGIGAKESKLKANSDSLKRYWNKLIRRLDDEGIIHGHDYEPRGHSYYLAHKQTATRNGNAFLVGDAAGLATRDMGEGIYPAIRSGIQAADAIISGGEYRLDSIPKYSFPSFFSFRSMFLFGR